MPKDPDDDLRDVLRREPFVGVGPSRLVKVVALSGPVPLMSHASGYVTQEKFILGRTPADIERLLGVRIGSLGAGCRVYRLARAPGASECTYELTTEFPDGLAFNPAFSDPSFPPGASHVQQWQLLAEIPVLHVCDLAPGQAYKG